MQSTAVTNRCSLLGSERPPAPSRFVQKPRVSNLSLYKQSYNEFATRQFTLYMSEAELPFGKTEMVRQNIVQAEMDDDVQSDSELVRNAKWRLSQELDRSLKDFRCADEAKKKRMITNYKRDFSEED